MPSWEFNSCETLIRGGEVYPIDYANACPDMSLISLHYYFRGQSRRAAALVRLLLRHGPAHARGARRGPVVAAADANPRYEDAVEAYRRLADDHFEVERYEELCARHLAHVDEAMAGYIDSPAFDALLVDTVTQAFPARHERFVAHYRGLLGAWVADQR